MKILLHVCCGPCSVGCIDMLKEENIEFSAYWYNPNIHPYTEYESRKKSAVEYISNKMDIEFIEEGDYGLRVFLPEVAKTSYRCGMCYEMRFDKAAKYASENGYDGFSSTLFVSPYQNHQKMIEVAESVAKKYGTSFFYRDFRPRFYDGLNRARAMGLYMQKYCGCIFSEEERYVQMKLKKKKKAQSS